MNKKTTKSTVWMKFTLLLSAIFLSLSPGHIGFTGTNLSAQVLLDSHSAGNGSNTWTITTSHNNELIIISAGGYGTGGNALAITPGTVKVNGNNATYITEGLWLSNQFSWQECIWAYAAPTPGTYTCTCTEAGLNNPWYFNFASSVYQSCPQGLSLANILVGGNNNNHGPTTISASITTTENGAWVYGSVDNNDNGHTGIVKWSGQLTETNFTYISDGVDGDQADSTYALAGTYNITSTDLGASNVWMTIVLIAVQPNLSCCPLKASGAQITNIICNGGNNASAYAIPINGRAPYTYSWTPGGQTTDTITGLSAGVYTVVISDTVGCSATAVITITQPPVITSANNITNVLCNGGLGKATVNPSGGASPYTYLWNPGGQTTATVTGLSVGTYTVSIEDINGCTGSTVISINQPGVLTATMGVPTIIACNGGKCSVNVIPGGGSLPYTYAWTPSGGTTAVGTGLTAGSYTVTITDINGCTASAGITITQPPPITAVMAAPVNVLCNGGAGSLSITAGGGILPYTYAWTPSGGTTSAATGLAAGSYTVTITDNGGCTVTASATITQPMLLTVGITPSNVFCNGGTGSATATVAGGTLPYTYAWNPGGQTTAIATALVPGAYTVTVKDMNGCSATADIAITQPGMLTAAMGAPNNVLCNGGTGNATVSVSGGATAYTYAWTPSGGTNATGTGLIAGAYTVTVKDANGCSTSANVTITEPAKLTLAISQVKNVLCNGGTGSATANVAGGALPYTYTWTPSGETTATATGLVAGVYTISITDYNNCTVSASVTITQPLILTATISATTNVSCYNGDNGTATVKAGGGTTPYTYLWTPSNNTNARATNFFALTYTVTITDADGCTATASTTITEPPVLAVAISEPVLICKDSTGNIYGNATGGTAPYKYTWSGGVTSTTATATITPIATRDYSVVVTDNNGCTATAAIVLKYGPDLLVEIKGKNSVCKGDSTTLCAYASGGEGTATYLWQPTNNTNNCINVVPGIASAYTVQVVDGCGATTTAGTTVYTDPSPVIGLSADIYEGCAPLCIQFRNTTSISQGGIRQYVWTFGNKDTSQAINPIYCYAAGGSYSISLTAISDSGCSATFTKGSLITVFKRPDASFTYSPQPVTILTPTIQFTDESTDKSGIAYHLWSFGDGSDSTSTLANPSHTYHDTGNYCANLVVMNDHGCTDTATNCFVIGPAFRLYIPSAFTPNGDGIDDIFQPKGQYISNFEMYIFDRWGLQLYHTTDINNGWDGTVHGVGSICQEDTYIYKIMVTDSQGNQHSYVGDVTLIK